MVPLVLVNIPVVGMLWVSVQDFPPPAVSLARMLSALVAMVLLLYLLLRSLSAIVASNTLGLSLFVMGLYPAAHSAAGAAGLNEVAFAWAYLTLCLLCACVVPRMSADATATLHDVLLTVAVVLILFTMGLAYRVYVRPPPYATSVQQAVAQLSSPLTLPATGTDWRPDVYDLVLDGMGRPDVLERDYGFSLGTQIDELRALGFEISPNGHANYVWTQLSLASMLNLTYLDELSRAEGRGQERGPLRDLISGSRAPALFKRLGYRVEFIGSGYRSIGAFEQSDVCNCPQLWFADAEIGALSLSPLRVLSGGVGNRAHYDRSQAIFELFERRRTGAAPRYVFAHVTMPHPPFVADERGAFNHSSKALSLGDGSFFAGSAQEYEAGYRAQAVFAMSRTARAVRRILDDAERDHREVVVIVHGDHGPRRGFDALNPQVESGQRALPTLLAIRWPAGRSPAINPGSLVNVYRVLFQYVFHVDVPQLPDRTYISAFNPPYVFVPVRLASTISP